MKISLIAFLAVAAMPSFSFADEWEPVTFSEIKNAPYPKEWKFRLKHEVSGKCLGIDTIQYGEYEWESMLKLVDCTARDWMVEWLYDPETDTVTSAVVGCLETSFVSSRVPGALMLSHDGDCWRPSAAGWPFNPGLLEHDNKCLVPRPDNFMIIDKCPEASDPNYANHVFLINTLPSLAPSLSPSRSPTSSPSMSSDAPSASPSFDQTNPWKRIPYPSNATVALSTNVNWFSQNGGALIDDDKRNESTAVGYPSATCNVDGKDLGYVTVDLGYNHHADAVKLYMPHGNGRQYCNVFASVWGDGEQEPRDPLVEHLTMFPTPAPTPSPTDSKPTEPPKMNTCHLCRGPKFICERSHVSTHCKDLNQQYCINDVENLKDGSRYVTRRCATLAECEKDWIVESADRNECKNYNVVVLQDAHFECSFCCKGADCNLETVPDILFQHRRSLAEEESTQHSNDSSPPIMERGLSNEDTLVYGSGADHGYAPVLDQDGFLIPFHPGERNIRYIRVWAGASSIGGNPEILEIEALWTPFLLDDAGKVIGVKPSYMPPTPLPSSAPSDSSASPTQDWDNVGSIVTEENEPEPDVEVDVVTTGEVDVVTESPTASPTDSPTASPIGSPTGSPTGSPATGSPTSSPTGIPTATPGSPTGSPVTASPTSSPTASPIGSPTGSPTGSPATGSPTSSPTGIPTATPGSPTGSPVTASPTSSPTASRIGSPTGSPTGSPATGSPTSSPTGIPTASPGSPTGSPTGPAATVGDKTVNAGIVKTKTASANGDPHFRTFGGQKYDFHGGCDLVLLTSSAFHNALGLKVHIRTQITTWWSSIASAVVQIGDETLEVMGYGKYWVNGKIDKQSHETLNIAGFPIVIRNISPKQQRYRIDLGNGDGMMLETYNDFVGINVKFESARNNFHGSLGLMGSYPDGNMVARNGTTVIADANAFGMEWQVQSDESMLFHSLGDGVHHPTACTMPDVDSKSNEAAKTKKRRRLGEALITLEDATAACSKLEDEVDRAACISDVLTTNDKGMAALYDY